MTLSGKINQDIYYSIEISENFGKDNKFKCIGCNEPLTFHRNIANVKVQHWNHKTSCVFETEPETEEHINMKKWCYENFKAKIKYKPDSFFIDDQKPDLFLKVKDKSIAIECQASKISLEKLMERTKKYTEKNIYVCWLLGTKNYFNKYGDEISISVIQKFLHKLYYGRVYYLEPDNLVAIHFEGVQRYNDWTGNAYYLKRTKKHNVHLIENYDFCLTENNGFKIARFYDKAWWIK